MKRELLFRMAYRMGSYSAHWNDNAEERYVVVWSMTWDILEFTRFNPGSDLAAALESVLSRLERDGWQTEGLPTFGSCFIWRDVERRLVMLTPRDPRDATPMSFSPFRDGNREKIHNKIAELAKK